MGVRIIKECSDARDFLQLMEEGCAKLSKHKGLADVKQSKVKVRKK